MNKFLYNLSSIVQSNFSRLSAPYKLTFAATYKCNSRCTICNIWKKPYKQELTLKQIQTFFQKNTFFTWVNLTGGELVLRNDLIKIIKVILRTQKKLLFLNFPTNGLFTDKIVTAIQQMLALHPPHLLVSVSLDGPKNLHDKLRGINGNWERAVETYKQLKKMRSSHFDCYFGMTISSYNYQYIEQTYKDLKEEIPQLQRSDIHFNIVHQSSHYYGNDEKNLTLNQSMIKSIQRYNSKKPFAWTKIALIEKIYQNLIQKYIQTKKTPISCLALSSSIFLDPYGNIYPCAMWDYVLGNLINNSWSLMKMWNSNKSLQALFLLKQKKCANCWTPCEAYQSIIGNIGKPIIWRALWHT
ncbi:MAG: Radical SAM domain protein [Microgenomates group bacterium GW2011_GWC1_39_12]|nr:MAG: Radical SAM domain protein [Microgenomates group bacterium GW2011_GWC1_39_12]